MNALTKTLQSTYKPQLAIVVYNTNDEGFGSGDFYLESHSINEQGQLLEGKPLLEETISGMVDVFFDDQKNLAAITGYIPENVLQYETMPGGKYKLVWYRPAEIRYIHFAPALKLKSGKAWMPQLVYCVKGNQLWVFATNTDGRPIESTKLFRSPFYNVSDDCHVCLGSARVKKPTEKKFAAIMKYWEDLFWLSEFSHLNGASNPTKTSMDKLWKRLVSPKPRVKWNDLDELKEVKGLTLKRIF